MLVFFTTGCWNRRELNEIAIVTAVGIDPGPKKGEIKMTFQVVNPSSISGKQGVSNSMTPFITIHTSGKTEFEAIRKATKEMSRRLYFSHLQAWIINNKIAKTTGINDYLEFPYRDPEIREDIPVFISYDNCSAAGILDQQFPLDSINGVSIRKHLENAQKSGSYTRKVELRELVNVFSSDTTSAVIPYIFISPPINPNKDKLQMTQSSRQNSVIKTEGFAVFKKDQLIGYLNSSEARAVLWITDKVNKGIIVVPYKGKNQTIEIMKSQSKTKITLHHGKPEVQVNIKINANVGSVLGSVDPSKQSVIDELEEKTNQTVKKDIEKTIKKVQKQYKVDIFKFGETFERQHAKEWKKQKKNWGEDFENLQVNIKVDTIIADIGLKNRSFEVK